MFQSEANDLGAAIRNTDIDGLKRILNQRLEKLQDSIDSTAESRKPVELDQASVGRLSRMDAMQMQAMAQATECMRGHEINRIQAALERIDTGDFGYCTTCGEEISPKRLAVDMTLSTCISCAAGPKP